MSKEEGLVLKVERDGYRLKIYKDDDAESPREWENLGTMVCKHRRYSLGDEQAKNTEYYSSWDEWFRNEVGNPNKYVVLPVYMYDHTGVTIRTTPFSCPWDSGQLGLIYCSKEKFKKETGYTAAELFSTDKHRIPVKGEHVRIKARGDKWGRVLSRRNGFVKVDFDYNKPSSVRNPDNIVRVSLTDIVEVMSNQAAEILRAEVEVYDQYIRGDIYGYTLEKVNACSDCGQEKTEHIDSCWGFYGENWRENGLADNLGEYSWLLDCDAKRRSA